MRVSLSFQSYFKSLSYCESRRKPGRSTRTTTAAVLAKRSSAPMDSAAGPVIVSWLLCIVGRICPCCHGTAVKNLAYSACLHCEGKYSTMQCENTHGRAILFSQGLQRPALCSVDGCRQALRQQSNPRAILYPHECNQRKTPPNFPQCPIAGGARTAIKVILGLLVDLFDEVDYITPGR